MRKLSLYCTNFQRSCFEFSTNLIMNSIEWPSFASNQFFAFHILIYSHKELSLSLSSYGRIKHRQVVDDIAVKLRYSIPHLRAAFCVPTLVSLSKKWHPPHRRTAVTFSREPASSLRTRASALFRNAARMQKKGKNPLTKSIGRCVLCASNLRRE